MHGAEALAARVPTVAAGAAAVRRSANELRGGEVRVAGGSADAPRAGAGGHGLLVEGAGGDAVCAATVFLC